MILSLRVLIELPFAQGENCEKGVCNWLIFAFSRKFMCGLKAVLGSQMKTNIKYICGLKAVLWFKIMIQI